MNDERMWPASYSNQPIALINSPMSLVAQVPRTHSTSVVGMNGSQNAATAERSQGPQRAAETNVVKETSKAKV
jgi:hypothetical protein